MNRTDIIKAVSKQSGMTIRKSKKVVTAIIEAMQDELKGDNEVIIRGFGRFYTRNKRERMARNPKTGEPAVVTARRAIMFKPAKTWKEELNR